MFRFLEHIAARRLLRMGSRSAIGNSNYYEMVWVHPDVECLQLTSDIFLDGYQDGLNKVDSEGMVDVPDGPGMGVTWDWDVIKSLSSGTKIID